MHQILRGKFKKICNKELFSRSLTLLCYLAEGITSLL
jgi:hypothetical protein